MASGLPDDSRDADERQAEARLRDLRGRVKRARAVIAATPGLADVLATDPRRAVILYARWGITDDQFRNGVPSEIHLGSSLDAPDSLKWPRSVRTIC